MRILIDTNIVIPLEDSNVKLNASLAKIYRICSEYNVELLIHSGSIEDIKRDPDTVRQQQSLNKLQKYNVFQPQFVLSEQEELTLFGRPGKVNDSVDNRILYSILKNSASFLISEDHGIHKKAKRIGIDSQVLYIDQALSKLKALFQRSDFFLPSINEEELCGIDYSLPFFDSLRSGYSPFNDWFIKSAKAGRKAWTHRDRSSLLGAILIYKQEDDPILTDDNKGYRGKVLKLCTLKVESTFRGMKIGELLLKKAFFYAEENKFDAIYLTVRQNTNTVLVDLLKDFGFKEYGEYSYGSEIDIIYLKEQRHTAKDLAKPSLDFCKEYFPKFLLNGSSKGFLVPIQPQYHEILFPELQKQKLLFGSSSNAGNAIKQAYLCKSNIKRIEPGHLLFFYRSSDWKELTSIGIVEDVFITDNYDRIVEKVLKRTVYSNFELKAMTGSNVLVILFRMHGHLPKRVSFNRMKELAILNGALQSIKETSTEHIKDLINESQYRYGIFTN